MTVHTRTPRWASMFREYTLSLALAATVAALTDWRDVRLELPGATTLIVVNTSLALAAALATVLFQIKWPGAQGLPSVVRLVLILLGPATVAALYMYIYPLLLYRP